MKLLDLDLQQQMDEAVKDYLSWPEWMKQASRNETSEDDRDIGARVSRVTTTVDGSVCD